MAQQVKPIELDDDGNPIPSTPIQNPTAIELDDNGDPIKSSQESTPFEQLITGKQEPQQGMISKVWDRISEPLTTLPSRIMKPVSDWYDKPQLDKEYFDPNTFMGKYEQFSKNLNAGIRGGMSGSLQAVGDLASNLTSPIDLVAATLSGGSNLAARAGLKGVSSALSTGTRLASAPVLAHGAINTLSPDSTMGERGAGLLEMAGGAAGMKGEVPSRGNIGKIADDLSNPSKQANQIIKEGQDILNNPIKDTAPKTYHQAPDWDANDPYVKRLQELTDKSVNGTLTAAELTEAQRINKIVRRIPPYDKPEVIAQLHKDRGFIPNSNNPSNNPNMKQNSDNTFTDTTTGEVFPNQPATPTNTQPSQPKIGQTLKLKQPSIENIAKARREGWEIDPKNPTLTDGKLNMIFTGKKMDEILEADIAGAKPTKDVKEAGNKTEHDSRITDAINLPRTIMASNDMSAPLRQGIGLIHKKEFWKALGPMFKSWKDEDYFNALQEGIANKPLFKKRQEQVMINGKPVLDGKTGQPKMREISSFAEDAGIKLTNIGDDLSLREESMMSRFADAYPGVTRSNRAYVGFLNKLRADTFETLMKSNNIVNPYDKNNAVLAKEMANFINNATGRGSLDFGKLGSLEKSATALNTILFSPRLIASRVQMMNPANYLMGNPAVRKEYLKSILAIGVAGNSILGLGSQIPGTSVEIDPRSKDFAKLKFDNGIRIDPWAGFQQYLTQTARQIPNMKSMGKPLGLEMPDIGGVAKSSQTGSIYRMGEKFGTNTRKDEAITFVEQKMNPVLTLITRAMAGKDFDGSPFNLPEEVVQRFIPIFLQDLKHLITENPDLLPFPENYLDEFHPENLPYAVPAAFGMGMQQYGKK